MGGMGGSSNHFGFNGRIKGRNGEEHHGYPIDEAAHQSIHGDKRQHKLPFFYLRGADEVEDELTKNYLRRQN